MTRYATVLILALLLSSCVGIPPCYLWQPTAHSCTWETRGTCWVLEQQGEPDAGRE